MKEKKKIETLFDDYSNDKAKSVAEAGRQIIAELMAEKKRFERKTKIDKIIKDND